MIVCLSLNNAISVINLETGEEFAKLDTGIAPYDIAVSPDGLRAYISNYGGGRPGERENVAPSGGSMVRIDDRGIAESGTVTVIDTGLGQVLAQIVVGLHPSDVELSEDGATLYVANANSDSVCVIDTETLRVVETIDVKPDPLLPLGSAPNALALHDGKLLVANGGNNAVGVFSRGDTWQNDGFIPAGWYPAALSAHEGMLYIANVKGIGSRSQRPGARGYNSHDHRGTVTRVRIPQPPRLAEYTAQVRENSGVTDALRAYEPAPIDTEPSPVPAAPGAPSLINHVVYIVKENRTYDQIFGDLPQGDGDPALCVYGRDVTPNHHALAEQFVLLDNYYCNGVLSADGHSWVTEGNVTDHLEKAFGGFTRSYTWGDDALTYSSSGFIWDKVLARGLSFRNYGEFAYATPERRGVTFTDIWNDYTSGRRAINFRHTVGIQNLRRHTHPGYPGWNTRVPDVLRADAFIEDLKRSEASGDFPNLVLIYLPQDAGSGNQPGFPTSRAHMADNDLALGRIVAAITKSPFWPETCIYVTEDDPQDGFDHVDGHRSICLVVSPYTKRGQVVSTLYNQTGVLHTLSRQLGMPPMNQLIALAPVMRECFTNAPDYTSYEALPNTIPLNELNEDGDG